VYACVYQERAEDVHNPAEISYERYAGEYEYRTHDQCSENPPEQYFMLIFRSDIEIAEYHDENKKIVDAKRLFQDIGREEIKCGSFPELIIEEGVKNKGQRYPEGAPQQCFPYFDFGIFPVKNAKVKHQHNHDKYNKANPVSYIYFHSGINFISLFSPVR
jgi:hypothetical protein